MIGLLYERGLVVYKEVVAFYYEVVMLPQNLSKLANRTEDAIYSGVCVFDSELESSASVVRQRMLFVFIFTVGYVVVSAGFRVREGGPFLFPCLVLFSTQVSLLLDNV